MDLVQLEIFKAVAEQGSISAAAQLIHRVPSNLTTRIKQLEQDLGVELFIREKSRLRLSPAGWNFLGYARRILDLVQEARFDVRTLCFEVTETAAITRPHDAARFMAAMRALGIRIALDDFGAGASSFGYLKTLPVDVLKIDGQFIRELGRDALDLATVRCFRDIAQVVGMTTVA